MSVFYESMKNNILNASASGGKKKSVFRFLVGPTFSVHSDKYPGA